MEYQYCRFEKDVYRFDIRGFRNQQSASINAPMMETLRASETSVYFNDTIRRFTPES
jgi:hypothetical protein